ncbi:MAG: prolyl oligopeptidase family serine peptidase [Agriterribacter sp.]
MKQAFVLFAFTMLIIAAARAQDTVYFEKGLSVSGVHKYGREALYTDLLAYRLYSGTLQKPENGIVFAAGDSGQQLLWKEVITDSLHRFRIPGRMFANNSYLYITYVSDKQKNAILNTKGTNAVYVNSAPHAGDLYASGWLHIPVTLKKGVNEFYIRTGFGTTVSLSFPAKAIFLNTDDPTIPVISLEENNSTLKGAVVVVNNTSKPVADLKMTASVNNNKTETILPVIPAMTTRKVIFNFDASSIKEKGNYQVDINLIHKNIIIDNSSTKLEAVPAGEQYSNTFISEIDGSLQYYAVTPQSSSDKTNAALFLSVHGAGVEAIGQARAYRPKDWGTLVAATNRRPRGFNWEDWGRLDAMEVLTRAKNKFNPDPARIYLTGHSMGGHGTWFLGATYPDKWAAIAPSAGYPTLKDYGSHDGKIPDTTSSQAEQILLRAGNQSDVIKLAENYRPLGVYIFHGDSDRTVSVEYARQMRKVLGGFHTDFAYKEYPGGSHWFSNESVDWPPLFNFFNVHTLLHDSAVNNIDFKTSSPGISATFRWATILQQEYPLQFSRIQLTRDIKQKKITGSTKNIRLLKLSLTQFGNNAAVQIVIDSVNKISYTTTSAADEIFLVNNNDTWSIGKAPSLSEKNPLRYGTFKEGFNHRMVFVYGTKGSKAENEWAYNKAVFDAESWYYRGNGAVDIIPDKAYNLSTYQGCNVILFGNAQTNSVWQLLLRDAPIQVERNKITIGKKIYEGDDIAAYFVYPIKNTDINSVAVISGTGLKGMKAANANQYFAGGSGFPDFMIFRLNMLKEGSNAIEAVGFFDNDWKLDGRNELIK